MVSWEELLREEIDSRDDVEDVRALAKTAKDSVRFTRAFGNGNFLCSKGHQWSSHRSCVTFDIQKERSVKTWRQFCKKCPNDGISPTHSLAERREMVKNAVDHFLEKALRAADDSIERPAGVAIKGGKPHRSDLCEACRAGKCSQGSVVDITSRMDRMFL